MHFKSDNIQSVQIMSPPLTKSPSIIGFVVPSSRGDPSFSTSSIFITDSSLNLSTEVGFASSRNPISQPHSGYVFPDSGSALPKPGSILPDSGSVLPKSSPIFPGNRFVLSGISFLHLVTNLNSLALAFLYCSMHTYAQPN
jgi:hypothetical protein